MTEDCDDYDGYKKRRGPPEYTFKGVKRVWPDDEEMRAKLWCLDELHSKAKCITDEELKKLQDEINDYTEKHKNKMCRYIEKDVYECLKTKKKLYCCNSEIDKFKQCVDKTIKEVYKEKIAAVKN